MGVPFIPLCLWGSADLLCPPPRWIAIPATVNGDRTACGKSPQSSRRGPSALLLGLRLWG